MCGTNPTALSAYLRYKARRAAVDLVARRTGIAVGRDVDAAGQPFQEIAVSTNVIVPRPIQVSTSPHQISSGTSVPEAAMPRPTPVKIAPPAMPRRVGGITAITVGAANAISTPPVPPDRKRQVKNQAKLTGMAQAN